MRNQDSEKMNDVSKTLTIALDNKSHAVLRHIILDERSSTFVLCPRNDAKDVISTLRKYFKYPKANIFYFDSEEINYTIILFQSEVQK